MTEQPDRQTAQTLDRGLVVLTILADARGPMSPAQIAAEMGISRPIVYRLLNTLAARRLVKQTRAGTYSLGTGVLDLTRGVAPDLQRAAGLEMRRLSDAFNATSILVVADGEEAVCLATVEPRGPHVRLRYPPGFRNPLHMTASGMAILASRPPVPGERDEVTRARERGYARSFGDIQTAPGIGVAAAIVSPDGSTEASIAVVSLDPGGLDEQRAAQEVRAAARAIAVELD